MKIIVVALNFLLLLVAGEVFATNFYVDSGASGTNDGTSWTDAWESFSDISWAGVSAGDTVTVRYATYAIPSGHTLSADGSSGNVVTLTAEDSDNKPVMNGDAGITTQVLSISGDYVTIENIRVVGNASGRRVINITGDNVTLDGVESVYSGGGSSTTNHNINAFSTDNLTIKNCLVDYSPRNGIYVINGSSSTADNGLIENTEIRNVTTHHAINIFPDTSDPDQNFFDGWVIRNCYIHDLGSQSAFFLRRFRTFKIYNNLVINVGNFVSLASHTTLGIEKYNANSLIANNTVYGGGGGYAIVNYVADYLEVKNNIFYGNYTSNRVIRFDENYTEGTQGQPTVGHDFDNNLYYTSGGTMVWRWAETDHTGLSTWQSISSQDASSSFINPSLDENYKSDASDDPAVGSGEDLSGTFTIDKDGITRVAWDIGAYEYQAESSPARNPAILIMN